MGFPIFQLISSMPQLSLWITYQLSLLLQTTVQKVYACFLEMQHIGAVVEHEVRELSRRMRPHEISPRLLVELGLQSAPNKEAYYQILVQEASYLDWQDGTLLMPSDHFVNPLYEVKKTIEFPHGLKALVITSEDAEEPPIIAFRGTDAQNIHNLMDDVNEHIGEINCEGYARELASELEALALEHGRVHLIGHSYGGAVVQHLTAKYPQYVARCTYHNAPGCGEKLVRQYYDNLEQILPYMQAPVVVSYRHAKDPASLLGGPNLPADPHMAFTMGSIEDRITHIEAHSFNALSTGALVRPRHVTYPGLEAFARFAEEKRRELARIVPLYRFFR